MRRKLLACGAILLGLCIFLFILAVPAAPFFARLGVKPVCIQGDLPDLKVVDCPQISVDLPALATGSPRPIASDAQPMVIDTDMAPDDWMAILFLLQRPDVDVKAITVTGTGEAHCRPGVQNALNLAALAGRVEIPVACGRETPLVGKHVFPAAWRDWADSLAGLSLPTNPSPPVAQGAVLLLASTLKNSPQKVTVVTLGPLTNLAEALQTDASLVDKINRIFIMGGAFDTPGNIALSNVGINNQAAEWNIYIDPHAANLVLKSGAPITFVPLDATNQAPITQGFYDRLSQDRSTPAAEFVYRVLTRQIERIRSGLYWFWDPLTAAISSDESLGKYANRSVLVVEEEGFQSGATRASEAGSPVRITTGVDRTRFETLFLEALNGRDSGT